MTKQLKVTTDPKEPRVAIIRTSDAIAFKGCRRRWDFSSHLRQNLGTLQHADPLWMGSGMHFALEDFHGFNLYGTPAMAMQAFAYAFKKKYPKKMPDDWMTLCQLCCDMMDYYTNYWLTNRPLLDTYVFEEVPQLEVAIKIPIQMDRLKNWKEISKHWDQIFYSMTLDRVVKDEYGSLWIMEYKSAKNMMTQHFATDPQCSRYVWGADLVYEEPVAGVIYQQHRKQVPKPARELKNGTISVAQQATSYWMYRQALIDKYGTVDASPEANSKFLGELAKQETEDMDDFVRRDRVYRNAKTSENEAQKILLEISEIGRAHV